MSSIADWVGHMVRAAMHLEGCGAVRANTGQAIMERMQLRSTTIPA